MTELRKKIREKSREFLSNLLLLLEFKPKPKKEPNMTNKMFMSLLIPRNAKRLMANKKRY